MKPVLKRDWAVRVYEKISGTYGSRSVSNKFSQIVAGVDQGIALTIQEIQEKLGVFADRPDAIAWMIDNTPSDHIPNVNEMRDLCKAAPRSVVAIEDKPEPADPVKVAEITKRVSATLVDNRNHRAWIGKILDRKEKGAVVDYLAEKWATECAA